MSFDHKKQVAILVPRYKKEFSESEKISMRHLNHYLKDYDKFFVSPKNLKIDKPEFEIISFDNKYFKSIRSYSKLMLNMNFYQKFSDYDFVLIYQLDALVFSDQLSYWCEKNYDYIGAPWISSEIKKLDPAWGLPDACGNGGFSLRKIDSHIKVLKQSTKLSNRINGEIKRFFILIKNIIDDEVQLLKSKEKNPAKYFLKAKLNIYSYWQYNEDYFWSFEAKKYYPNFKIADVDTATKFAFEIGPKYCFEKNNKALPFGCHAWEKFDKDFWLPYLLK